MNVKEQKQNIIQAGYEAVKELIKVAKEPIVETDDDVSADRLKNAAATKKLAIFDAFEILNRIETEKALLEGKNIEEQPARLKGLIKQKSGNMGTIRTMTWLLSAVLGRLVMCIAYKI